MTTLAQPPAAALSDRGAHSRTCWIVVARPRSVEFARWGTLPGAYVLPPGDLVCDPCCGAGTTLEAALRTGRRAVGGDAMREHAELAAARVSRPVQRPLLGAVEAPRARQCDLFANIAVDAPYSKKTHSETCR